MREYTVAVSRRVSIVETSSFVVRANDLDEAKGIATTLVARHNLHGDPELTWSEEDAIDADIGEAVIAGVA